MIIIQTNIIYNFEDLRILLSEKAKIGSYFLLSDDLYFEEIQKDRPINRYIFLEARKLIKPLYVMKHLNFNVHKDNTTKDVYDLIQTLNKFATIIVTIFEPKKCECNILFITQENDLTAEKYIKTFLELEVI